MPPSQSTCAATTLGVTCQLPAGHDSPHRHEDEGGITTWEPRYVGELRREVERLRELVPVCDVEGCDRYHRNDLEHDACTECGGFFCGEHINSAGTCTGCRTEEEARDAA